MAERASRQDVEALLALAITRRAPSGACPTLEEIAEWHEGTLVPVRRESVVHHLAHCDACFAVFTGLLDSADLRAPASTAGATPAADTPSRRQPWFRRLLPGFGNGGLAAGFALAVLVAILVPILQQPTLEARLETGFEEIARSGAASSLGEQWPWPAGYQSRAIGAAEPTGQVAARAFRAGLAAGLDELTPRSAFWSTTIAGVTPDDEPCQGADTPDACPRIAAALFSAGRWAALLHVACAARADESATASDRLPDEFWDTQAEVLPALQQEVATALPGTSFARLLRQWQDQLGENRDRAAAFCGRASTLITLGLGV